MIRFHGTPLTPTADMVKAFSARHAMVSFNDPRQIEIAAEICQSVALDNGAFSAWRAKVEYDFAGYVQWASKWLRHPCVSWAIIPDVIDGTEDENDRLLLDWPLPKAISVPVWHMHESLGRLDRLAAYPRLAIGSSGKFKEIGTDDWWCRITEAMDVICDAEGYPRTKLHGLRMLDPGVFSKVPLSSADSCNVARSVGLDERWRSALLPKSRAIRAQILMERIENHACAAFWNPESVRAYQNMELFG